MGHIKNYNVRLMTLLAALVGMVAILSHGLRRIMFQTSGGSRSKNMGPIYTSSSSCGSSAGSSRRSSPS